MADYTDNLNLKKPAGTDNINIADINGNMDLIDAAFGEALTVNEQELTAEEQAQVRTNIGAADAAALALIRVTNVSTTIPDKTVPSGSTTDIGTLAELPVGEYIILITLYWATNGTGYRDAWLSATEAGSQLNVSARSTVQAVTGSGTRHQIVTFYKPSSPVTLHVVGQQNSGSSLALYSRYSIIRLK